MDRNTPQRRLNKAALGCAAIGFIGGASIGLVAIGANPVEILVFGVVGLALTSWGYLMYRDHIQRKHGHK